MRLDDDFVICDVYRLMPWQKRPRVPRSASWAGTRGAGYGCGQRQGRCVPHRSSWRGVS